MGKGLFGGGGGGGQVMFVPPPPPPPAANPPTMASARVQAAGSDDYKKAARGMGFAGTDKSSGMGVGAPPTTAKQTLGS